MNTIILLGNKKNDQIKNLLLKMLSKHFNINLISSSIEVIENQKKNWINLIETNKLERIHLKKAILILKDDTNAHSLRVIDETTNVIVNSSNTKSIIRLSKTLTHVYSCGFSSKDYMTFSSREEDQAVVSLQRSITLLNNEICEPLELPFQVTDKINDYSILATALTMLLLKQDTEKI